MYTNKTKMKSAINKEKINKFGNKTINNKNKSNYGEDISVLKLLQQKDEQIQNLNLELKLYEKELEIKKLQEALEIKKKQLLSPNNDNKPESKLND